MVEQKQEETLEERIQAARKRLLEEDSAQRRALATERTEGWISFLADLYKEERDYEAEIEELRGLLQETEREISEKRIQNSILEIEEQLKKIKETETEIVAKHPSIPRLAMLRSGFRKMVDDILIKETDHLPDFRIGLQAEYGQAIDKVVEAWREKGFLVLADEKDHLDAFSFSWDGKAFMIHPDYAKDRFLRAIVEDVLIQDFLAPVEEAERQEEEAYRKKIEPYVLGSEKYPRLISSETFESVVLGKTDQLGVIGVYILPLKREKEGQLIFYGRLLVGLDVNLIEIGRRKQRINQVELKVMKTDEHLLGRMFGPRQNDPNGSWRGQFSIFFDVGKKGIEDIRNSLIRESIQIHLKELKDRREFRKELDRFISWKKLSSPITFEQLLTGKVAGQCPVSIEGWDGLDKVSRKRRFRFDADGKGGYTVAFPEDKDERETICNGLPKPGEYRPVEELQKPVIKALQRKNERFELGWVIERAEEAYQTQDFIAVLEGTEEGTFIVFGISHDDEKRPLAFVFKRSNGTSDAATLQLVEKLYGSDSDTEKRLRMKLGVVSSFSEVPDPALYFLLDAYCRKKGIKREDAPSYLQPRRYRPKSEKSDAKDEESPRTETSGDEATEFPSDPFQAPSPFITVDYDEDE
ncbi:MAG: hypothetical protein HY445_02875 [Candidatus Niyogibacteria bacterium]|nr:hypothetical protein [Candidatus Niyogibacteria bacterium]